MRRSTSSWTSALLACVACLGSLSQLGCADRSWETAYRLERAAALAFPSPDTAFLDFGTEVGRKLLIDGWSFNETNDAGLTFVWSHGPSSSFGFYALPGEDDPPSSVTLEFRVLPFDAPDAPPQSMRFELNGHPLGEVALPTGITESTIEIPDDVLIVGWNVFDVHYAWTRSGLASQVDRRWRRADRDLAVAWIDARLKHPSLVTDPVDPETIAVDLRGQTLDLPARHLLEFEFEFGRGSRMVSGIRCAPCPGDGLVEVYLGAPDRAAMRLAGTLTHENRTVPLEVDRFDTYRLLLRNPTADTLVLESPRVERPAASRAP